MSLKTPNESWLLFSEGVLEGFIFPWENATWPVEKKIWTTLL
jgi:hypothetical protein